MTHKKFSELLAEAKKLADSLSCDAIDCKPRDIDWRETMGEDMEGWMAYEAFECDECGRLVVTSTLGEDEHRNVEPTLVLDEANMPEDGAEFKCLECDEKFTVKLEEDGSFTCPECETTFDEGDEFNIHCMGYINAEGPMMNYWYPVRIKDCREAARKIAHLPLCVVEFRDGETGLALTGGGMDLTWEICRAFIAIGYLPPAHFSRPPRMAGWEKNPSKLAVLVCCEESARVQSRWAESKRKEVEGMIKEMRQALTEEAA